MTRMLVLAGLVGCQEPLWADQIVDAPGADPDRVFGDPALAVNGVRGAGCCAGGTDVYTVDPSLGRRHLVLGFSDRRVLDGPGDDLIVFENAFEVAGGGVFMDPTVVEVSPDGVDFVAFPHSYLGDPDIASADPDDWPGFAGRTPVTEPDAAPDDPFDPEAGGDAFDLADLTGPIAERVRAEGVLRVRILPAGPAFPRDPIADGPDIDGVVARGFSR